MKQFKLIDFWINVVLITGFTIYCLIKRDETFFVAYFVIGGWQIISMLVHFIGQWFCENGSKRYNYQWLVLIVIFVTALGIVFYSLLYLVLLLLLFAAPAMAIYYTWICYQEVYIKMQRPLALLK